LRKDGVSLDVDWVQENRRRKDKMHGANGGIGRAIARAFAVEGAWVFVTGRRLSPVQSLAKDMVEAGGSAEAAEVDAIDEQAVGDHLQSVIDASRRVASTSRSIRSGSRKKRSKEFPSPTFHSRPSPCPS
jgi:shikimate 5-dehydrogenase